MEEQMFKIVQELGQLRGRQDAMERRHDAFEIAQKELQENLAKKIDTVIDHQRKQIGFIAGAAFAFSVLWTALLSSKEALLRWVRG